MGEEYVVLVKEREIRSNVLYRRTIYEGKDRFTKERAEESRDRLLVRGFDAKAITESGFDAMIKNNIIVYSKYRINLDEIIEELP